MSRSRQLSALLVVIGLVLAACGGDDADEADPQPTTTAPTTIESPEAADEAALRQLAEDWFDVSRQAYIDPDFDLARLDDFLTDDYLQGLTAQIEDYREAGHSSEPGEASRHMVEELTVEADSGLVTECIVDGEVLLDSDGAVINDAVVTRTVETTAVRTAVGWRFSNRESIAEDQEGDQCGE